MEIQVTQEQVDAVVEAIVRIRQWFYGVCERGFIRQATCTCNVSGPIYTWTYGVDE